MFKEMYDRLHPKSLFIVLLLSFKIVEKLSFLRYFESLILPQSGLISNLSVPLSKS